MTRLPAGRTLAAAGLSGLFLALSFPSWNLWPLALVAPALLVSALRDRGFWSGCGIGLLAGLAFYLPLITWSSRFLGPIPWLALSFVMSLSFAVGCGCIAIATRAVTGRLWLPVTVAGLWICREQIASTWPYGGFAWGRIAQSQSEGPLLGLVAWLGLAGMGFVLVWWSVWLGESIRAALAAPDDQLRRVFPAVAVLAACTLIPPLPQPETGSIRLAAVQGGTEKAGYFRAGEPGDVFTAHLDATRAHVAQTARPEAVIWPEGSVDVRLGPGSVAARELSRLSSEYGNIPILANTVTFEHGATANDVKALNTQFRWEADRGITQTASKRHPVPFGEYIPDRDFFYALAPDLIGMVGRGYSPGTRPSTLDVAGHRLGVIICFDVIDDAVIRDTVAEDGASALVFATNNADFDRTPELHQQIAFARMRSVETGRASVQISTVGESAAFDGAGRRITAPLPWYTPAAYTVTVPTSTGLTPAMWVGPYLAIASAAVGPLLLVAGLISRRHRRTTTARDARADTSDVR